MKHFRQFILLTAIVIFAPFLLQADIVTKEDYSIDSKIEYKQSLNISVLSFSGELNQERNYIKDLIRNAIIDKIFLYKKFRFSSYPDFKRNKFSTADKSSVKEIESDELNEGESINGFLNAEFLNKDVIEKKIKSIDSKIAAQILNPESKEYACIPGADIIITGQVKQDRDKILFKIKTLNSIYKNVSFVSKSGTFKNIHNIAETISIEIIKSIIIHYAYLDISCNKENSFIYIDDRYFGCTNKSGILIESGAHEVLVKSEKSIQKKYTINLQKNKTKAISVIIPDSKTNDKFSLEVNTAPDNAEVYLDSNYIGVTPLNKDDIPEGTYRLRVEKNNYITEFRTVRFNKNYDRNEINLELERGDTKEEYFNKTSAYRTLFKCSLWGAALSSASYVFWGIKVEDANSKLRDLSASDPGYSDSKSDRDNFLLYRQISLYTLGALIISSGIFYYLDISQNDISIALNLPFYELRRRNDNLPGISSCQRNDNLFGITVTKSF